MHDLLQEPNTGEHLVRFVGDSVRFTLRSAGGRPLPAGWRVFLRTNLGRAAALREEILAGVECGRPPIVKSWHDVPMRPSGTSWDVHLPLTEVGYFRAKAYAVDARGWQHWPQGPDVGLNVQPNACRTWNTIYCAFVRMFGPTKNLATTAEPALQEHLRQLDAEGYATIPPSGKLRDLVRELPHIFDVLGCRILHLLPVNPVPTTYARFGRFGSPYAAGDLLAIDPALIEFDKRTTGVDQFRELTRAVHAREGWVFLDMAINHTGWESTLHWQHPEWFMRRSDGTFVSPGAWGTTWEDLVELEHGNPHLRRHLAEVFIEWCRRGVDGFRCDAGYFVPLDVWRYIIARVRQEFPDTVFFLEGLGGAWEITADLLTEGGFQWAYSELFQNYDGTHVGGYLDHAIEQSRRAGILVHYSETHDNNRIAANGRAWSLLRNRLCALTSVSGCFGFTCGVEWLATEKIDVHGSSGLAWGNPNNIIPDLGRLNRLLGEHPCFFDGARLQRLSPPGSTVYALKRTSRDGADSVLVLVNLDTERNQTISLPLTELAAAGYATDLLGQQPPSSRVEPDCVVLDLPPASAYCLADAPLPLGLSGDEYRKRCAAKALALAVLTNHVPPEQIDPNDSGNLADWVERDLAGFLSAATYVCDAPHYLVKVQEPANPPDRLDTEQARSLLDVLRAARNCYPRVILWDASDRSRVTLVPPAHWLMIEHPLPFSATIEIDGEPHQWHARSVQIVGRHVACYPPRHKAAEATLRLQCHSDSPAETTAKLQFLDTSPALAPVRTQFPEHRLVLLTNARGGMARLCLDFGAVCSKYDCLLGANLHQSHPVDRHILAKRARLWVVADGFLSPLDARHLISFDPGPPAEWFFQAPAGDGRLVGIRVQAVMLPGRNTTVLRFSRQPSGEEASDAAKAAPALARSAETRAESAQAWPIHQAAQLVANSAECGTGPIRDLRVTLRVDMEDRSFHQETFHNAGAEHHFASHISPIQASSNSGPGDTGQLVGFAFTPAPDRRLRVWAVRETARRTTAKCCRTETGASSITTYHPQPEWCDGIKHPVEATRGLTAQGDAYSPGWFELSVSEGAGVFVVACADPTDPGAEELASAFEGVGDRSGGVLSRTPASFASALAAATNSFLVRRGSDWSVIAGYPWFLEWGRDSLVAARGLIAAGRLEEVQRLLILFGRFEKDGTLPNTIIGDNGGNRDSSDAPLWYGLACEEFAEAASQAQPASRAARPLHGESLYSKSVDAAGRTVADVLRSIAGSYLRGTPNGIRVDPHTALVWSPSHFTWMDTNYPACTPREGYPVEIQALWVRFLRHMDRLALPPVTEPWGVLAARAMDSIHRLFWLDGKGWLADVLRAQPTQGADNATPDKLLRSNCLFPIALGLVKGEKAQTCVKAVQRHLLVAGAIRSLAPLRAIPPLPIHGPGGRLLNNPEFPYWGRYEGDEDTRRKPAYHNGTAWVWTLPVFCEALARAWDFAPPAVAAALAYLGSAKGLMASGCVGQLPEILDGDAPHTPRGCDAQAWSATETLRVWRLLGGS